MKNSSNNGLFQVVYKGKYEEPTFGKWDKSSTIKKTSSEKDIGAEDEATNINEYFIPLKNSTSDSMKKVTIEERNQRLLERFKHTDLSDEEKKKIHGEAKARAHALIDKLLRTMPSELTLKASKAMLLREQRFLEKILKALLNLKIAELRRHVRELLLKEESEKYRVLRTIKNPAMVDEMAEQVKADERAHEKAARSKHRHKAERRTQEVKEKRASLDNIEELVSQENDAIEIPSRDKAPIAEEDIFPVDYRQDRRELISNETNEITIEDFDIESEGWVGKKTNSSEKKESNRKSSNSEKSHKGEEENRLSIGAIVGQTKSNAQQEYTFEGQLKGPGEGGDPNDKVICQRALYSGEELPNRNSKMDEEQENFAKRNRNNKRKKEIANPNGLS